MVASPNTRRKGSSRVPHSDFETTLNRLKATCGAILDEDLANFLDIKRQGISQARAKGKVPSKWFFIVSQKSGYSVDWLKFGNGPKLLNDKFRYDDQTESEQMSDISEKLSEYHPREDGNLHMNSEHWRLLGRVHEILKSDTIYKSMLIQNINMLFNAIQHHRKIEELEERIKALEEHNKQDESEPPA